MKNLLINLFINSSALEESPPHDENSTNVSVWRPYVLKMSWTFIQAPTTAFANAKRKES